MLLFRRVAGRLVYALGWLNDGNVVATYLSASESVNGDNVGRVPGHGARRGLLLQALSIGSVEATESQLLR